VLDARLWPVWLVAVAVTAALVAAEALLLVPAGWISVDGAPPQQIYIGARADWGLSFELGGTARPLELEVLAELDPELEPVPLRRVRVEPGEQAELALPLRPKRRGALRVEALWLGWRGPLGLLERTDRRAVEAEVQVVPDVGAVRATALRALRSPQAFVGLKTERFLGDGTEFDALRQYVPGLDPRSIDWKASARHKRLYSRRYRAERNHQVVLAVDSGHLMGEPLDGTPRVDHAINAALLLAYFCLRTGDRVGMASFDARFRHYLEPQGGLRAFRRLQQQSAAIEYCPAETNYALGVLELSARLRRRSLVVVFTEFVDNVTAQLMLDHLDRLARKHVVVFVALRDPELEALELDEPARLSSVGRAVVAADLRRERETVFQRLQLAGVHLVDARPGELAANLLERYFQIKRRELV
jgi:uncharacterized protein (DUF58 family)